MVCHTIKTKQNKQKAKQKPNNYIENESFWRLLKWKTKKRNYACSDSCGKKNRLGGWGKNTQHGGEKTHNSLNLHTPIPVEDFGDLQGSRGGTDWYAEGQSGKILFTLCLLILYYCTIYSKYTLKYILKWRQYPWEANILGSIQASDAVQWISYKSQWVFWLQDFHCSWIYKKASAFNNLSNKIILVQQMRFTGFTKFSQFHQHKTTINFLVSWLGF